MRVSTVAATGASALAAGWVTSHLRSPAVKAWRPSGLSGRRIGRLWCRTGGSGATGVLLLHGLIATGDVFGRAPDMLAADHVVAVPDLLGFGRSLDVHGTDFGTDTHLAALDMVVDEVFDDRPIVIGAHSMGSTLALRWAAQHPDRVERVICIGAPLWPTAAATRRALGGSDPMTRALLSGGALARGLCRFNCEHRTISGVIAAAIAPRWPIPVARQASLHTWPSYQQALHGQVLHDDWPELLDELDARRVRVRLVWGDQDPVGDQHYATQLVDARPHLQIETVADADHTLLAARPDLLFDLLRSPMRKIETAAGPDEFGGRGRQKSSPRGVNSSH